MGSRVVFGAAVVASAVASFVASSPKLRAQDPVVRASVSAAGGQSNDQSSVTPVSRTISNDGRFVVFGSSATNLVPNDTNGWSDVFVRDLVSGTTIRVNVSSSGQEANFWAGQPTISGDGRFVAYYSAASNLVANDTNGHEDVFLYDRDPDGNGVFDEGNATTTLVSVSTSGIQGDAGSFGPSLSDDGDVVVFTSYADNLVGNDKNGKADVFVLVRSTDTLGRASVDSNKVEGNGDSVDPMVSGDGTHVVFKSLATNLTPQSDGSTTSWDVFVRDRIAKTTTRASETSSGVQADGLSEMPAISGDGRYVVFATFAANLWPNDHNQAEDVCLKDMTTGTTTCMTVDSSGVPVGGGFRPSISRDGLHVAFSSDKSVYVPNDTNNAEDVFVRDVASGSIVCASVNCAGAAGDDRSERPALSSDGRYVVFESGATDLVDGDTNGVDDVFVNDLANPGVLASWNNYGAGWPGTHGVPSIVASAPPQFGTTFDVVTGNSLGTWAVGFLLLGDGEASIPTSLGGTVLVDFASLEIVIVPPSGFVESYDVPIDPSLCGLEFDFQMLEIDGGASKGVSFSPGLALFVGR
jgi:Tol biopolymer transport system component